MVPHLRGRALTLRRFPEGVDDTDAAFFEKRCPKHRPGVGEDRAGRGRPRAGDIDYCVCDRPADPGLDGAAGGAGAAPLALARRGRRAADGARLRPRPRPAGRHRRVLPGGTAAARALRPLRPRVLRQDLGLEGHAGLRAAEHARTSATSETKPFARAIAQLLEKQTPDEVVSKMKKAERKGKVFVDWCQNHRRKTTIAVYSLRARERPTVSTPVTWDEVERAVEDGRRRLTRFEAERGAGAGRAARRSVRAGAGAEAGAAGALAAAPGVPPLSDPKGEDRIDNSQHVIPFASTRGEKNPLVHEPLCRVRGRRARRQAVDLTTDPAGEALAHRRQLPPQPRLRCERKNPKLPRSHLVGSSQASL